MNEPQLPEPYEWQLSSVIVRFVVGILVGGFCGLGIGVKWLGLDTHDTLLAIIGGAALFGVASVLFGDRFWKSFLNGFSRE